MRGYVTRIRRSREFFKRKDVFLGVDVHKGTWTLTAVCEGEIVYDGTTAADLERLEISWPSSGQGEVHMAYEAGGFGFWLAEPAL